MANVFIDGFDLYPAGRVNVATGNPWVEAMEDQTANNIDTVPKIVTASPISGTRSLKTNLLASSNITGNFAYVFLNISPLTSFALGFALNIVTPSQSSTSTGRRNYVYLAGCGLRLDFADNLLRAYVASQNANNGTALFTGTTNLPTGSRVYIEVDATPTTLTVYINGTQEFSGAWAPLGSLTQFQVGKTVAGPTTADSVVGEYMIDDFYLNDATGAENNGPWGDTVIVTMLPNGDGGTTDWTPVGAATGWEATDNVPPDPAIYIESLLSADEEILDVVPLPPNVFQIHTVYTAMRAMKTIAGATEVGAGIIQGGVQDAGTPVAVNQDTFTWHFEQFVTDPSTGVQWNPTTFNPQIDLIRSV